MEIEALLKVIGPTGAVGALLLIPKIRALLWELILMVAIALAKKHYDAKFEEFRKEMEDKISILIQALGRDQDQRTDITAKMTAVRQASVTPPPPPSEPKPRSK